MHRYNYCCLFTNSFIYASTNFLYRFQYSVGGWRRWVDRRHLFLSKAWGDMNCEPSCCDRTQKNSSCLRFSRRLLETHALAFRVSLGRQNNLWKRISTHAFPRQAFSSNLKFSSLYTPLHLFFCNILHSYLFPHQLVIQSSPSWLPPINKFVLSFLSIHPTSLYRYNILTARPQGLP